MADKPTLLLIDDEERILRSLAMLFRGNHDLHTTTDPHEALALVSRMPVHVIVSDQKMPVMRGADLLKLVKERSPSTMRILLTGYSELDAVVASVNEGEIYRFVNKPWDAAELRGTVAEAANIALRLFADSARAAAAPAVSSSSGSAVLVIDEDSEVYQAVKEISTAPVIWATHLGQAMEALEQHRIGVIVSELAVQGESVSSLLKLLKAQHPEIVSIVLTPVQDVGQFIGLINQGQIYRLLPKPLRRGPFGMNLASALRHHDMLKGSPLHVSAHKVQPLQPAASDAGVASRVLGFLSRMRTRTATG
ncbi:MAG TPA: response regulator [Nevskiaceae bacterium]|nr:response regulator [Nevskiaceae bacterium]